MPQRKTISQHSLPSKIGEDWFRTTLYSIGDAVITTDPKGKILQMNPVAEKLTGWNESEARGQTLSKVFQIVNEQTRKKVLNPVQRILREGIVIGLANHTLLIARDGTEYPIADAGAPIKDSNGKIIGVVLVFRDQTAERKAQRAVQDAREFAESIIATIREPLLVLDNKLEVVSVNRSFLKTFQVTPEETIGRKVYDLGNRQWDIPKLRALLEDILPLNSHFDDFEVTHTFERIGRRTMLLNARRLLRDEHRSQLILLAIEDITERKKEEEKRRLAEERFRRITNVITDYAYTFRVNPDMTLAGEWVSDSFTKAFGYSLPEIDARGGWQSMVYPDDLPIMQQHALKVIGGANDIAETRFVTRDGTIRWIRDYATPVWDEKENRVVRIYGAAQDITERKQAEEALRANEQFLRQIMQLSPVIMYKITPESFIPTWVSENITTILGYSVEEALKPTWWKEHVHPNDRDRELSSAKQIMATGHVLHEYRFFKKNGELIWVRDEMILLRDNQGKPLEILGAWTDITESKRSEEALHESEERYRRISDLVSDYAYAFRVQEDRTLVREWVTDSFTRITGYTPQEVDNRGGWASIIYPDDMPIALERAKRLFAGQRDISEFRIVCKDGTIRWLRDHGYPEWDDTLGRIVRIYGAAQDITERKQAEEALRANEQFLRQIMQLSPVIIYKLTPEPFIPKWVSENVTAILGYSVAEVLQPTWWQEHVHPEDYPRIISDASKIMREGHTTFEYRLCKKNGEFIWVRDEMVYLRDEEGKPLEILGALTNITKRKEAELALKANEERYRSIVENLTQAYYETDPQGAFTYCNPGLLMIGGYTKEELLGTIAYKLVAKEHRAFVMKTYKQWLKEKRTAASLEFKVQVKSGRTFWVEQTTHLEYTKDGNLVKSTNILRDIDERKRAEEELRRSEERYERFFMEDLSGDFISTTDGRLVACNPAFVRMFGFASVEEALNTNTILLYSSSEEYQKVLSRLRIEKKLENYEMQMYKVDGSPLFIVANIIGKFDEEGTLTEIQGYLFDDTKRRQLEEALRQAQKLESIGTLASGVAHDFNNILAIVLGHASLLEKVHHIPEKLSMSLDAITTATQRGASLVKQLLTFARKSEAVFAPLDVNTLVKELSKMLYETFPRTISIRHHLNPDLPAVIADVTQIHQVLLNLSVNARDAMPKGGTLTFTTDVIPSEQLASHFPQATSRQYVMISVSDTGVGMDSETRSRIFEPFFTTKAPGHGTGLGLAVVHGVLGTHKGFVDVESQPGKGSTFRIYLPAAEQPLSSADAGITAITELPRGTETVLIVEDEEHLLQVLVTCLENNGYTVITARDGYEALEHYRARANTIALVISDIGIPRISGDELFRKIKEINPAAKVMLATGFIDPKVKSRLLASGVMDILPKPYTLHDVLLKTRKVLDTPM